jgi:hypothetical protein
MDEETNPNTIGNAFYLTLSEAARRVGRNKGSLSKAIAAGRLSALRCPETNSFKIDPAELHRYAETLQVVRTNAVSHSAGQRNETRDLPPATPATELLEARIADLKTMLDELKADRERQIQDLRQDRDRWQTESDRWRGQAEQALRLALPKPEPRARLAWWRRLRTTG